MINIYFVIYFNVMLLKNENYNINQYPKILNYWINNKLSSGLKEKHINIIKNTHSKITITISNKK